MHSVLPLPFVDFTFLQCAAADDIFYDWKTTENRFNEGVLIVQGFTCDLSRGHTIRLDQLNQTLAPGSLSAESILLQVVHLMPLVVKDHQNDSYFLHEMVVVAWAFDSSEKLNDQGAKAYKFRRLKLTRLYAVLEGRLTKSKIHCYKKGHLGLFLKQELFKVILDNSRLLEKELDNLIESGKAVYLGFTFQEASENCTLFSKATQLLYAVFENVDMAVVSFDGRSSEFTLSNRNLIVTGDFEVVLAKPGHEEAEES